MAGAIAANGSAAADRGAAVGGAVVVQPATSAAGRMRLREEVFIGK
jgi:hypothetical protein